MPNEQIVATTTSQSKHTAVDVKAIRARNRATSRRAHAVSNVIERLEHFGVLAVARQPMTNAVIRQHAEQLVDAVLALTRADVN